MRLVHPLLALLVAAAVACGDDGPTGPTPPGSGGDGTGISGHTVDAVTGAPLGGITVRVTGYGDVVSDSDGTFIVDGTLTGASERRPLTASSVATIERSTFLRVPADNARLSLIPASFDLASFDAMFRGDDGILRRWTAPPPLVIERSALVFTDIDARRFTAADDVMSESEAAQLVTDLEWALDELSAGTFTRFASVRIERAEPGASVVTVQYSNSAIALFWVLVSLVSISKLLRPARRVTSTSSLPVSSRQATIRKLPRYSSGRLWMPWRTWRMLHWSSKR